MSHPALCEGPGSLSCPLDPCLGAAGGPEGGWGLHGAHREGGMVCLVALGLKILGIDHRSLSRKMPWPDGWEGMHGTFRRF